MQPSANQANPATPLKHSTVTPPARTPAPATEPIEHTVRAYA